MVNFHLYAKNASPYMEVIDMVTFMVLLCIVIVLAIIIATIVLAALAIGGASLGILLFLFGDIVIGITLTALLIKKIAQKRK